MTLPARAFSALMLFSFVASPVLAADKSPATERPEAAPRSAPVDLFQAIDDGQVDVKFIAKSSSRGRVIIENMTGEPVDLQLPEAFAGVPVLAQFGGGGQGGGGFGGGGGGGQATGGGFGGGGGQGGFGGGGGGQFRVAADKTAKLDVALLCLEHGKKDPSSSKPYKIVPVTEFVERPEVVELLKAFGRGGLNHGAAQAAAWNLNNDLSWDQLQAKLAGSVRDVNRRPYFSRSELQAALAYAGESRRLATENASEYRELYAEQEKKSAEAEKQAAREQYEANKAAADKAQSSESNTDAVSDDLEKLADESSEAVL